MGGAERKEGANGLPLQMIQKVAPVQLKQANRAQESRSFSQLQKRHDPTRLPL